MPFPTFTGWLDELLEASEVVEEERDLGECCKDTKDIDSTSSLDSNLGLPRSQAVTPSWRRTSCCFLVILKVFTWRQRIRGDNVNLWIWWRQPVFCWCQCPRSLLRWVQIPLWGFWKYSHSEINFFFSFTFDNFVQIEWISITVESNFNTCFLPQIIFNSNWLKVADNIVTVIDTWELETQCSDSLRKSRDKRH